MSTTPEMQNRIAQLVETFQIDHGIAMPEGMRRGLSGKILKSLLRMMGPDPSDNRPRDSFLVPCENNRKARQSTTSAIGHAIRGCKKRHPDREFTCRVMEGGVRCWRVK